MSYVAAPHLVPNQITSQINAVPTPAVPWTRPQLRQRGGGGTTGRPTCHKAMWGQSHDVSHRSKGSTEVCRGPSQKEAMYTCPTPVGREESPLRIHIPHVFPDDHTRRRMAHQFLLGIGIRETKHSQPKGLQAGRDDAYRCRQ